MSETTTPRPASPGRSQKKSRDERRRIGKTVVMVLAIGFVCLGVVVTRAVWDGRVALAEGDAALSRGDHDLAVSRWCRAARWYVPLAPHVERAYDRLEHLARQAEADGDVATALAGWRGIRGSILATRSVYTPFAERLEPASQRIAALMAGSEDPRVDPGRSEAERAAWHLDLLTRDESPSVAWTAIALLGLAAWLGGGFLFALRGITDKDELVPRAAALAGILIGVGLFVWMLGLHLA